MSLRLKTIINRVTAFLKGVGTGVRKHWQIPVALVALLVLIAIVAGPVTLAAPRSCDACHRASGEYAQWAKSAHAGVGCEDCHVDRAYLGGVANTIKLTSEVGRWLARRSSTATPTAGNTAWVPDAACLRCHPDIGAEPTFVSRGLNMSHKGLAQGRRACVECHGEVAHAYHPDRVSQPTMTTCARCHNNVEVSGKCDVCHVGDVSAVEGRRRDVEMAKTHGTNWRSLHGMGDLETCTLCHESSKCVKCHGMAIPHGTSFGATHGRDALKVPSRCLECHTQAFCDSCHGITMPHPKGFLAKHSSVAEGTEDSRCERCHPPANCNECHEAHIHPPGGLLLPSEKTTGNTSDSQDSGTDSSSGSGSAQPMGSETSDTP